MDPQLEAFWDLVRQVGEALHEPEYYKAAEPRLVETLRLVQENPELQSKFEEAFLTVMENPDSYSILVVEFCMYVLRYPRIRDYAEARLKQHALPIDMHARHVLEAYDDNWRVAELFPWLDANGYGPGSPRGE